MDEVGIRKISIVMSGFFRPHQKCFAGRIIPTAGFLLQLFAALERFSLSSNFKRESASHSADRIHVLDFNFSAELRLFFWADRNVAVATQSPFLHVCVAAITVN